MIPLSEPAADALFYEANRTEAEGQDAQPASRPLIKRYFDRWDSVPIVAIDTETTGVRPGFDRACQVALVLFHDREPVLSYSTLVNPCMPMGATSVHGITDEMVKDAPTIEEVFASPEVVSMLDGAQPLAYNAPFDREMVVPFGDWTWPWLDPLVFVRLVDRFAKGPGRHTLAAACGRHGVELTGAHDAKHDARAAGELFFRIKPKAVQFKHESLGDLLCWQETTAVAQRHEFLAWKARQP